MFIFFFANRALYPTKPLQAPDPDLIELIEVPKKLKEDSVQSLEAIKKLFDLKPIIKKTPQDLINNITEASSSQIQATKDIEFKEEVRNCLFFFLKHLKLFNDLFDFVGTG